MRRFATCSIRRALLGTSSESSAQHRPCSNLAFTQKKYTKGLRRHRKKKGPRFRRSPWVLVWFTSALLRRCGAGVELVRVFRLDGVVLSVQREGCVVAKGGLAEVAYFRTVIDQGISRDPCVGVGIGDGLDQLMRKSASGGVDERTIGAGLRDGATRHILVGLHGKEHGADACEIRPAVVGAKNKRGLAVGRITLGRRQTDVGALWQKDVINVRVPRAMGTRGGVHNSQDVVWPQSGVQGRCNGGRGTYRIAVGARRPHILIGDANEVAMSEIREKVRRFSPASSRAIHVNVVASRMGENRTVEGITEIGRVKAGCRQSGYRGGGRYRRI